jgi:hypothetical protein
MLLKTNIYQQTDTHVDFETGEIHKTISHSISKVEREPNFVKLYIDDLSDLAKLQHSCSELLWELVKRVNYTGTISISAGDKKVIVKELGIKSQSFANNISQLIKKNILFRIDTGMYQLNPYYFAKGAWFEVQKQRIEYIELTMKYTALGKEIVVNTIMKEENE